MLISEQEHAGSADLIRERVAKRIAREVRRGEGSETFRIAKVSSLLHAFRVPGRSTRLADVQSALDCEGIELESGWVDEAGHADIRRSGVVRLQLRSPSFDPGSAGAGADLQFTVWRPGQPGEERTFPPTDDHGAEGDVLWFDIDAPADPSEIERRATSLTDQLAPWCPGLDVEMLRDLLREDPQPKVETYGDDNGSVRSVSVVAAIARELPGADDDSDGVAEEVVFQLVELLVGDGWIASCWHRSQICGGADAERSEAPLLKEPFISDVRRRWTSENESTELKTSSDLGICLVRSLIQTYDATHRMMERWMAQWEVEFYTSLRCSDRAGRLKAAAGEISDFLYLTAEIRRRLTAFQHARWSTSDRNWFPDLSDQRDHVDEEAAKLTQVEGLTGRLDSAKQNFDRLSGDIRANMDVLMLQSTATQQESTERVQNYLGKVTGLVLVPTLIVGLFGANTALPGGGSWMGFELMLMLMLVSGVAVYFVIRRLTR